MRPIVGGAIAINALGAAALGAFGGIRSDDGSPEIGPHEYMKLNDTRLHLEPAPVVVQSGFAPPPNVEPAYGTFKDISGWAPSWSLSGRWGPGRGLGAGRSFPYNQPFAIIPLRPRISGVDLQVTNPDARYRMPGYTSDVPVSLSGEIAQALRKPYMGNQGV